MTSVEEELKQVIKELKSKGYQRYSKDVDSTIDLLMHKVSDLHFYHEYLKTIEMAKSLSLDRIESTLIKNNEFFALNKKNIINAYLVFYNAKTNHENITDIDIQDIFDSKLGFTNQELSKLNDFYNNNDFLKEQDIKQGLDIVNDEDVNNTIDIILNESCWIHRYEHEMMKISIDGNISNIDFSENECNSLLELLISTGFYFDRFNEVNRFLKKFSFLKAYEKKSHDIFEKRLQEMK